MKRVAIFVLVFVLLTTFVQAGTTITVGPGGSGAGYDYGTIQDGINAAVNGDTVIVADGTYTGTGNKNIDFLGKAITVQSQNGPENCIINVNEGTWGDSGFYFQSGEDSNSVITGFTITGPGSKSAGILCEQYSSPTIKNCIITSHWAGIWCYENSSPTITGCTVTENHYYGIGCNEFCNPTITDCTIARNKHHGGIGLEGACNPIVTGCTIIENYVGISGYHFFTGRLTIKDCTIAGNSNSGIWCSGDSLVTISGCIIANNSSFHSGGGIALDGGDLIITNSVIRGNSIQSQYWGSGGGIYCSYGNLKISNCLISGNSATMSGGGIACSSHSSRMIIANCRITGNFAAGDGGGLYLSGSAALANTVIGCTITSNIAGERGGGIYWDWGWLNEERTTFHNSILWDNEAPDGPQVYIRDYDDYDYVPVAFNDIQGGLPGEGNIDADSRFVNPGHWSDPCNTPDDPADDLWTDGDYHLLSDSPCIDAGDPGYSIGNVVDEQHRYISWYPAIILDKFNIDTSTIAITDITGVHTYTLDDDYTITETDGWVTLNLTTAGTRPPNLTDYQTISVDYQFDDIDLDGSPRIIGDAINMGAYEEVLEAGIVILDRDVYSCSDTVEITVRDLNLKGNGLQEVTIESSSSDLETVDLMETNPPSGIFNGIISTTSGQTDIADDILQVSHDSIITVTYYDANNGTGNPATVTDTATTDCRAPVISNVLFDEYPQGPQLMITFETDEPTTARVLCGLACGGPYTAKSDNIMATSHAIVLDDYIIQPDIINYFVIEVNDIVENNTTDDDNGNCYAFTAAGPRDIYISNEHTTIQQAIDDAWEGSTIWVADGIYTGDGNKNIDFKGKLLTVRSENGPEACIIDCENDGRGFYFHCGETLSARLEGFTICNGGQLSGYIDQVGIWCDRSSPTIINCIIRDNSGGEDGGILCENRSNPLISGCAFTGNSGGYTSGVRTRYKSNPIITNCTFTANNSPTIRCETGTNPRISNCLFNGNSFKGNHTGSIRVMSGSSGTIITNCIIRNNHTTSSRFSAGISCSYSNPTITNCTIVNNSGASSGISCEGDSRPKINNCIVWGNSASQIYLRGSNHPSVSYCDIQGGWPGEGNISDDPLFVNPEHDDYHLLPDSPCIDAGDPDYVPGPNETDLDGNPRITGHAIDMGAYEFGPLDLLLDLTQDVIDLNLQQGLENSLLAKLNAALQKLEDTNENNDTAAINLLEAFINAVQAQRGKKISETDADALIATAQQIIELLNSQ